MPDPCPHCGADLSTEYDAFDYFRCGTVDYVGGDIASVRSPGCYETELTQLRAEVGRLTAITTSQHNAIEGLMGTT